MNVPTHCDWRRDGLNVGFLDQERPDYLAEVLHGTLGEMSTLAKLSQVQVWVEVVHMSGGLEGGEKARRVAVLRQKEVGQIDKWLSAQR